jgi:hypothetical protein
VSFLFFTLADSCNSSFSDNCRNCN